MLDLIVSKIKRHIENITFYLIIFYTILNKILRNNFDK